MSKPGSDTPERESLSPPFETAWNLLDHSERLQAARALLDAHPELRDDVNGFLARRLNFRPVTVAKMGHDRRAKLLAQWLKASPPPDIGLAVLTSFHLAHRVELLASFLDALGIQHSNGVIVQTDDTLEPPSEAMLRAAYSAIASSYPSRQILIYFLTLVWLDGDGLWRNLAPVLVDIKHEAPATADKFGGNEVAQDDNGEPAVPESSEEFTTLDNVLIKSVVASLNDVEGSLTHDQLRDLIEEVIALNSDRQRSHFHRGFLNALLGEEYQFTFQGENLERRIWYLTGVLLGLLRQARFTDCLKVLDEQASLVQDLAHNTHLACGRMLAPPLYPVLRDAGRLRLAATFLSKQLPHMPFPVQFQLVANGLEDAASDLRNGKPAEALLLLDTLADVVHEVTVFRRDIRLSALVSRIRRKQAQAHQFQGNFGFARRLLETLTDEGDPVGRAEALADIGLIDGGFRTLAQVHPGAESASDGTLQAALEKGASHFRRAIEIAPAEASNAHYCLAVMASLKGDSGADDVTYHMEQALAGMLRKEEAYERLKVIHWARFLLGLARLEQMDAAALSHARDLLERSLAAPVAFPLRLWERCLAMASLADAALVADLGSRLLEIRGDSVFEILRDSAARENNAELRRRFIEWVRQTPRSYQARWADWRSILASALLARRIEEAQEALDELERLAGESSEFQEPYLQLLLDSSNYSPAWEAEDAEDAQIRVLESLGRLSDAADLLVARFYRRRAVGTPEALWDARQILDHIGVLQDPNIDIGRLAASLPEVREPETPGEELPAAEAYLRNGGAVRLLYVGGDEMEARMDAEIRSAVQGAYSGVTVEFYHPSWKSHWGVQVDAVVAKIAHVDAVVLSRRVRTQFGQKVRKACTTVPWFAHTGRGRQSTRAILLYAARRVAETTASAIDQFS